MFRSSDLNIFSGILGSVIEHLQFVSNLLDLLLVAMELENAHGSF